jgi:hypothetical protein
MIRGPCRVIVPALTAAAATRMTCNRCRDIAQVRRTTVVFVLTAAAVAAMAEVEHMTRGHRLAITLASRTQLLGDIGPVLPLAAVALTAMAAAIKAVARTSRTAAGVLGHSQTPNAGDPTGCAATVSTVLPPNATGLSLTRGPPI